jgi:hypothetical protein
MRARAAAWILLVVTFLGLAGLAAPAVAEEPPPAQQALLLLRILAYDRQLKARAGTSGVVVAVAHRPGDKASLEAAGKITRALEEIAERTTVLGMKVSVLTLPVDATLEDKLRAARPAALYVAPGLDDAVAQISQATRKHSVLSLAPRPEPVQAGLAVGFAARGSRTAVIVNLPAARAEGVDFESAFLRVAEVIKP